MSPESLASNTPEWSVSELAGALKRTLEDAFGHVRLRGEIFGYRGPHASGHVYFCLKDRDARLDAVIWKGTFARLRFRPQEGLEVIATGRITTFPGKSSYQIVIDALEPAGIGALMALLEERRRKLAAEGLFEASRKRRLPFMPRVIGVVTSPSGAVIRDILHRLADRFPVHVLVWPARVQGETCAEEVACGIRGFNRLPPGGPIPRPDVIIVARGGGSLEDLWGFNEEAVVRAAVESAIPLVSAVGHETDWTLIDHAADLRAPTPTGAAELAVPVRLDLLASMNALGQRHAECMLRGLETRRRELRSIARALPGPEALLAPSRQRLDLGAARLGPGLLRNARVHERQLAEAAARLSRNAPAARLAKLRGRLDAVRLERLAAAALLAARQRLQSRAERLTGARGALIRAERLRIAAARQTVADLLDRARRALSTQIAARRSRLGSRADLLGSLGYKAVLARGYVLVRGEDGRAVVAASQVGAGQPLRLDFIDGPVRAVAEGERVRKRRSAEEPQPTLFDA